MLDLGVLFRLLPALKRVLATSIATKQSGNYIFARTPYEPQAMGMCIKCAQLNLRGA